MCKFYINYIKNLIKALGKAVENKHIQNYN